MKKDIFVYIETTHKKRDKIRVRQHVNIVFLFAIGKKFRDVQCEEKTKL